MDEADFKSLREYTLVQRRIHNTQMRDWQYSIATTFTSASEVETHAAWSKYIGKDEENAQSESAFLKRWRRISDPRYEEFAQLPGFHKWVTQQLWEGA
jgi:hypothetical protein